jgi:hypothetical protein
MSVIRLARRMTYRPRESAAYCETENRFLNERVTPRAAGQAARDHCRRTGHPTTARHVQTIGYRLEDP